MKFKKNLGVVTIDNLGASIEGQEDKGWENKALDKPKNTEAPLSKPLQGLSILTVGVFFSKKIKARDKDIKESTPATSNEKELGDGDVL